MSSAVRGAKGAASAGRFGGFARGAGGKFGLLSVGLLGLDAVSDFQEGGIAGIPTGFSDRAQNSPITSGLGVGDCRRIFGWRSVRAYVRWRYDSVWCNYEFCQ